MVFEEQTIGQIHHAKVLKRIAWVAFNGSNHPKRPRREGQPGWCWLDITLIHDNENHRGSGHGQLSHGCYFEVTETRFDIAVSCKEGMDEGLPNRIPFLPDNR